MSQRQTYSLEDIKDMLLLQVSELAYRYAPPAQGSYEDKGKYFTLNPGRADRSVGSFYVYLSGPKAGQWRDHATGDFGDIFDLIKLSLNCDMANAVREARAVLGLQNESPDMIARRQRAAARAKQNRRTAARSEAEKRAKAAKNAHRLWLSAASSIADTPVEFYLRDRRGIDLRALGHQPGALRFLDRCFYKHVDPKTSEEIRGHYPAMVSIVNNHKGEAIACHRTYLGISGDGIWDKAAVPATKKVLGDYAGGWINIWKGSRPDGKRQPPLTQCAAGTTVYVAEGIEDSLSAALILPEARHIAAISLSNLASLKLPDNVAEVVFIADQDDGDQAKAALERAIATHQAAGRRVRIWQNNMGGKDLNDALQTITEKQGRGAA